LNFLTDALLRSGRENLAPSDPLPVTTNTPAPVTANPPVPVPVPVPVPAPPAEALTKRPDINVTIRMARLEWNRAVYLASNIGNPTYRSEMLYKVAESVASGSASLAIDFGRGSESEATTKRQGPATGDRNDTYRKLADVLLVDSWEVANKIDRLIWKYRAMVRIALSAADSRQYLRAVELSRGIDNAEARAEAMLILAESESRQKQDQAASTAYELAAEAVASVSQDGLRGVLAGFLVDSLIATGRFGDARACIELYPAESQRLVALGAIAESQGRRGLAESARRWITIEVAEQYRPTLYRRVTSGVLWAMEQNRGRDKDLLSRPEPLPIQ
jgi:hypothetical protein